MRIRFVVMLVVLIWTTPSPPPLYGEWLVWDCPYGYDSYIFLSRPDGSEITRLSRHYGWLDGSSGGSIIDQDPHWSIDGKSITYSYLDELYRMAVNGSGKQIILQLQSFFASRILTHVPSPDGKWIVVVVDSRVLDDTDKDELYLMSADGSESYQLAMIDPARYRRGLFERHLSRRIRAAWSKDGKMITLEPIRLAGVMRRGVQVDVTDGSIVSFSRFEQADDAQTRFKPPEHLCTEPSRVDVFRFPDA